MVNVVRNLAASDNSHERDRQHTIVMNSATAKTMTKRFLNSFRFSPLFGWFRRNTSSRRKKIKAVRSMYQEMGLVENGCKLCAGEDFTLLSECDRYGFDLKKQFCNTCGLVQTYPTVSDKFLEEFYSNLYRPLYTKAIGSVDYPALVLEQREKGRNLASYLKEHIDLPLSQFHLVEIGCSSGGILFESESSFQSVQGCDLDIDGTEYARTVLGLKVETAAIPSQLPEGPRVFLMSHVLEHLNHPLERLREVKDFMRYGDFFVVMVPGLNAVRTGDYKHDLRRYFHIAHLTDFSAGTLRLMAEQAGLSCLHIDERVNAILKLSNDPVQVVVKSHQDSLSNIAEIEKTRPSGFWSV